MEMTATFNRDMGYSYTEFFRVLPGAARGYELSVVDNRAMVTMPSTNQKLLITVTRLPDRELAMMRLPHVDVRFEFDGFDEQERREFMKQFDKSYQRGGG